jgi:hypothetical protein
MDEGDHEGHDHGVSVRQRIEDKLRANLTVEYFVSNPYLLVIPQTPISGYTIKAVCRANKFAFRTLWTRRAIAGRHTLSP